MDQARSLKQTAIYSHGTDVSFDQVINKIDVYYEPTILHRVLINEKITDVAIGEKFSVALTESGDVYYWGTIIREEFNYTVELPTKLDIGHKIVQIAAGRIHAMFVTNSGMLYAIGYIYGLDATGKSLPCTNLCRPTQEIHSHSSAMHYTATKRTVCIGFSLPNYGCIQKYCIGLGSLSDFL
jgi:hypothetical protein